MSKREIGYKNKPVYVVDVLKTDDGIFSCPNCDSIIDPNDESEVTYEILEIHGILDAKMKIKELDSLIIGCKKCRSKIKLTNLRKKVEYEK